MAKKKLTKAIDLINEVNETIAEVKGLLNEYDIEVSPIIVSVPFGIKELSKEFKAELKCSPPNELTGLFDAYFDARGVRFVTYFISERDRPYYEEVT